MKIGKYLKIDNLKKIIRWKKIDIPREEESLQPKLYGVRKRCKKYIPLTGAIIIKKKLILAKIN